MKEDKITSTMIEKHMFNEEFFTSLRGIILNKV